MFTALIRSASIRPATVLLFLILFAPLPCAADNFVHSGNNSANNSGIDSGIDSGVNSGVNSGSNKNTYALEFVLESPGDFPAENNILTDVIIEGRKYAVTHEFQVFCRATEKRLTNSSANRFTTGITGLREFSGTSLEPGLSSHEGKAVFAARFLKEKIKVPAYELKNRGLTKKIIDLVLCSALCRPVFEGLGDLMFQYEKVYDEVIKKGGPVPEDIIRELIIKKGRARVLKMGEYILDYPAHSLVLGANEFYSHGAAALYQNHLIRQRISKKGSIDYEEALAYLKNEGLTQYLWIANRLNECLAKRISPVSPAQTRDIEETALLMDLAGFEVFESMGPAVSVFEREIWEWDKWAQAPLHTEIDDFEWWQIDFSKAPPGITAKLSHSGIFPKLNKYSMIMKSSARARDIWDAHRWTWDKKDWMRYHLDRARLIRLRAAMVKHHYNTVKAGYNTLESGYHTMTRQRFIAEFEPLLRESLRRLGMIRAFREFMDSAARARLAQSSTVKNFFYHDNRPADPAYTVKGLAHLNRSGSRYSRISKFSMLGYDIELEKMMALFDDEKRKNIIKKARDFEKHRHIIEKSLAENNIDIIGFEPGKPGEKSSKEIFEIIGPDIKRDKKSGKRVLQQWDYSEIIDLDQALKQGLVSIETEPAGSLFGPVFLNLAITRLGKKPFQLFIPAGTLVKSRHKFAQDLVIRTVSPTPEEGYEKGHLVSLVSRDPAMESRKPCRVVLGVPVFALTHNAPLPDAATPMVITGQTCEFGVGRILDVHSDALMNRNSLSRVFANSPELIGLLDRKEILARPWLDLIAQLSIWAVTSGLNRDFMLREALAYADDRGLIKLEDQAAAETALIARCVQAFLDAADVRINFYEPGIRYNPKVEVVSDLKVPEDVYLYKKGVNLYEQGRFNESEKAFSKIISDLSASLNFYDSFRVKEWILRCRFRQGQGPGVDPAIISPEEIKKMLALSPVSVREYARLMSMNLKEHAFNSDTAVLMGERWPEFYFYFAEYLMKNKKYTPALENFYRFLKVYEKRDDLHRLRIIRYDDEEDFKDTYTQNSYIKDMAGEYRFLSARAKTWIMLISAALTGAEK